MSSRYYLTVYYNGGMDEDDIYLPDDVVISANQRVGDVAKGQLLTIIECAQSWLFSNVNNRIENYAKSGNNGGLIEIAEALSNYFNTKYCTSLNLDTGWRNVDPSSDNLMFSLHDLAYVYRNFEDFKVELVHY